jgi:hypothetical protein
MTLLIRFGAKGMLLLSFVQSATQKQPTIVNLTVIHNGRQRPAPAEITVSFGAHSLRIPVQEGKFETPPEVVAARRVTLEADVEGSHIRLIHVTGEDFTQEDWTLRLAERANDDYYDWPGPKRADISTTCMLEFESAHTDPGRILFQEHCRSKKK